MGKLESLRKDLDSYAFAKVAMLNEDLELESLYLMYISKINEENSELNKTINEARLAKNKIDSYINELKEYDKLSSEEKEKKTKPNLIIEPEIEKSLRLAKMIIKTKNEKRNEMLYELTPREALEYELNGKNKEELNLSEKTIRDINSLEKSLEELSKEGQNKIIDLIETLDYNLIQTKKRSDVINYKTKKEIEEKQKNLEEKIK